MAPVVLRASSDTTIGTNRNGAIGYLWEYCGCRAGRREPTIPLKFQN